MESWYKELTQTGEELFLLSNSGYTNDQLVLRWLEHFIKCSGTGMRTSSPDLPPVVLFCDNLSSHCTDDFDVLAKQYGIVV
ncbi:hypothetical protein GcM3_051030 [Golovinomyces cichoracearum]|uniref:DDE-1 domain-containing protein n=1 Tax=Golovinomyces cichoracearum TaxID=62708 RepID=A0A420IZ15_9PEZI|nr:hypothetical protein GcM3_051030 [Golovinomyces cichoracearum]